MLVDALAIRIKTGEVRLAVGKLKRYVMNWENVSVRELVGLKCVRGRPQNKPVALRLCDGREWQPSAIANVVEKDRYRINRFAVLNKAPKRLPND